ncbi:50S ribosomal protein L29 [Candidatus Nomurabacteria bacterium RIFCSPLOWO2_02_FULL_44_12]|uniref:Large ribosomal subunit protein uL29 n=1 Tax=Candidatus Nomurabacteria bacterium RIFCSPLOWO2_12_FULL_44_11 TaxID=1801796 RepID=A0A1F6Y6E0_9BACT|nr:MAG: 50S ribosomal protein L29 [Candidatus Nomurabacteria bacterium RIFCSPHIGHO2_12_FULL_44_22b]OGJ01933.1 MAG: 50S ribosomal protein L29 [Candidatus Nomurabacteria bacterium RIFCSPLOWO2_12_FULL_44_11]OGJ08590.1 MAG: 50S ribosomal protein L29 [Candidatus Nomurabacteria bacterium RIFCSPLOWO2_02_FULL_44_12]
MSKKKENLRELSQDELSKKLVALREDLRVIRFKTEGAKSKNVKESLALRKNIARVLTAINQK